MKQSKTASMAVVSALALMALPWATLPWSTAARSEPAPVPQTMIGRDLTEGVCGACHVVSADSKVTPVLRPPAPSFRDVLRRSSFSEGFLRRFLASGHGRIAPMGASSHPALTDEQTNAVVAYILTLKAGK